MVEGTFTSEFVDELGNRLTVQVDLTSGKADSSRATAPGISGGTGAGGLGESDWAGQKVYALPDPDQWQMYNMADDLAKLKKFGSSG